MLTSPFPSWAENDVSEKVETRKVTELIPHKSIQVILLSPFAEFLNPNAFVPSHVRTDLPPYRDVLGIHCSRRRHLGGAGAVEVGKAKRTGGHVGVEVALPPTKEESMFWVSC